MRLFEISTLFIDCLGEIGNALKLRLAKIGLSQKVTLAKPRIFSKLCLSKVHETTKTSF